MLAAASPRAADGSGVAFQFSRADAVPAVARVAPASALGGMGDVLHATGANLHAAGALFWTAVLDRGGGAADAANAPFAFVLFALRELMRIDDVVAMEHFR